MLVETQKLLIHWFMKAQSRDLTKWLCAKRVLLEDNQGICPLFAFLYLLFLLRQVTYLFPSVYLQ